jgi:hypothetical protein
MLGVAKIAKETALVARGTWCNLCGARLAGNTGSPLRFSWRGGKAERPAALSTSCGSTGADTSGTLAPTEALTWSICLKCYQERMRCATCGTPVGGQAFMLEGDLRFYCAGCFHSRPRCDTCDRPVGAHYWTRPDGRKLCDRCQSTAVTDTHAALALFERVKARLGEQLGLALREPCQLRLVGRRQLLSMVDRSTLQHLDADSRGRCFGIFVRQGRHKAIFVEYGLPQIMLLEVMAHEYAHAWQSENSPPDTPLMVQEGFAEWVAYKMLEGWGCYRRSDRMLRRDDLYGRGLKLVLSWEAAGGRSHVFSNMVVESPKSKVQSHYLQS